MVLISSVWPSHRDKEKLDVQVLEVATGERNVRDDLDLAITGLGDDDLITEVTDTALDLDAVVQELLERRDVEDLVACGLRSVDGELFQRQNCQSSWSR